MSEETGLEKAATRTPAIITTPEEYRGALLRWQEQRFHVLTPFSNISGLAASHGIVTSLIQIDTERAAAQVYDGLPFLKKDEVALSKNGLRKIAEGLGISTRLEYISTGTIQHYWHVKAIATYRGLDGATITREASMEWDLREGSDRLKGWTSNQTSEARKHGIRACETRAINAAIRECGCGVKQAYGRAELLKPFVAVRVAFQPDMSDPDIKRQVTERALGGTHALYAPIAHGPIQGEVIDDHDSSASGPRRVGSGSTTPASTPKSDPPPADEPPTPNAVRIVDVQPRTGSTNGRPWTKWTVVDNQGVEYSTFSRTVGEAAIKFRDARTWVDILDEQSEDGKYRNIADIGPAQPSLLPDPGNL